MFAATNKRAIWLIFLYAACAACLRVVTFNIHAWRDANHSCNFDRLVELLNQLQPDVLCLNEVLDPFVAPPAEDPYWEAVRQRRGYGYTLPKEAVPSCKSEAFLNRLADALELPHFAFGAATMTRSFFGKCGFGNAILSKHVLSSVRRAVAVSTEADLYLGGQKRTHQDLEDRGCLLAIVELPCGVRLGMACAHLDHKAEELRERQCCYFLQEASDAFGPELPYMLCGDLNSFDARDMHEDGWQAICALYDSKGWPPPRSRSLVRDALAAAGLRDTFGAIEGTKTAQCPPPTSWTATRIDYIMARDGESHGLRVTSHRTVPSDTSDHSPVVVDVEIRSYSPSELETAD